jgi:hypothetical protein
MMKVKVLPDFNHEVIEAEEQVALQIVHADHSVFTEGQKAVVEHGQHLIHSLDIPHSWVQLCVDKQYSCQHISVGFNVESLVFLC